MNNMDNQCDHLNLEKIEEDTKQGHSLFKCLDCGRQIVKDKQLCTLCGGLPVDNIVIICYASMNLISIGGMQ
jgi:hypothetical protein